jgi:hypothetical protein
VVVHAASGVVAVAKPWVQQNGGGHGPNAVSAGGAVVRTRRLTGGLQRFRIFFQFIQNRLNIKKTKWVPYLAPKIPNFGMCLVWDIMNNFLNCANIQFTT